MITQNGEAKAVLQDSDAYEQTQETPALLRILALGQREIETEQTEEAAGVFERLLSE